MILSRKLGAAFTLKPSRGFLEPYQTQVIEVEAYSNMWGSYRDNVVCNIEGEFYSSTVEHRNNAIVAINEEYSC